MVKIKDSDLLLVIDMQNVYKKGMDWSCDSFSQSVVNIQHLIDVFPAENVAFTKYVAAENPVGIWKNYNIENKAINENDFLNEITDELAPYINESNLFIKSTYSSLKNKDLLNRMEKVNRVFVTGVVAECCVLSTVFELIDLGKKVYYICDAVSGENLSKENAIKVVLDGLTPLHIEFLDSKNIM